MTLMQYCEHGGHLCAECLAAKDAQIVALEAEVERLTKICGATHPLPNLTPFVALAKAVTVLMKRPWTVTDVLSSEFEQVLHGLNIALAHPAVKGE